MKNSCPLCVQRKAQRRCKRQNNTEICSLCCAQMRNETCAGCSYYATAQQYRASQNPTSRRVDGHFVVELNPKVEAAVDFALQLAERGKLQEARTALTQLLGEHSGNHYVCYGMGTLDAISGELKESIKWFDQAISASPYFIEAHFNKALSHQKLFDIRNAIVTYRKVVELGNPGDLTAKQARSFLDTMSAFILQNEGIDIDTYLESQIEFDRAFELLERRDWSGALAGFRASAQKHDRNATTHGNMGLCLAHLGHKAEALAQFDRALEIDPQYLPAVTNRAIAEKMKEGTPLKSTAFKIVEFAKEQLLARRK